MNMFLSCDWGTTSFRLRLVKTSGPELIAEEASDAGIAAVHEAWIKGGANEEKRVGFYLHIIHQHVQRLALRLQYSLYGIPVIISGMASSSIGMLPLPYSDLPFALDGSGIICRQLRRTAGAHHDIFIISGVKSKDDVMRGEETQLIGYARLDQEIVNALYVFPGTHSKHIQVKDGLAVDFSTFMTGELFDLLSKKSILSNTVEPGGGLAVEPDLKSFSEGVTAAQQCNLLHQLFRIRAAHLLEKMDKQAAYYFLSGLLIGTEISSIQQDSFDKIILCCSEPLQSLYKKAFAFLAINNVLVAEQPIEEAVMKGQYLVYKKMYADETIFMGTV